ncbi:hypothetical protein BESB_006070 [Besnoitia besnoiti]|uniref:Glycosyltransferase n=1 Tax=Besnoitia besnoiti TaxID=94643 RepID=A0A2A9MPI4_BESBE|nr:hypothetical protein BESB_006070 [Besnoitia besnoiti]PFH38266.1 hypothetical protein BESB_006070 [Besnoitia besnoiti]
MALRPAFSLSGRSAVIPVALALGAPLAVYFVSFFLAFALPLLLLSLFFLICLLPSPSNSTAFFHPDGDSGAGGERVLWSLVAHQLRTGGVRGKYRENETETEEPFSDVPSHRLHEERSGVSARKAADEASRQELAEQKADAEVPCRGRVPVNPQRFVVVYLRHDSPWLQSLTPVRLPDSRMHPGSPAWTPRAVLLKLEGAVLSCLSGVFTVVLRIRFHAPRSGYVVTAGSVPARDVQSSFGIDLDPFLPPAPRESAASSRDFSAFAPFTAAAGACSASASSLALPTHPTEYPQASSLLVFVPVRCSDLLRASCYPFGTLFFQLVAGAVSVFEVLLLGLVPTVFVDTVGVPAASFVLWALQRRQSFSLGARDPEGRCNGASASEGAPDKDRTEKPVLVSRKNTPPETRGKQARDGPRLTRLRVYVHYPFVRESMTLARSASCQQRKSAAANRDAGHPAACADSQGERHARRGSGRAPFETQRQGDGRNECGTCSPLAASGCVARLRSATKLRYYRGLAWAYAASLRFAFRGARVPVQRLLDGCEAEQAGKARAAWGQRRGDKAARRDAATQGDAVSVSCCNSSWTRRHLEALMNGASLDELRLRIQEGTQDPRQGLATPRFVYRAPVVFPPCQSSRVEMSSPAQPQTLFSERPPRIMSLGQFRPEKRQQEQVLIFGEMVRLYGRLLPHRTHLVVAGAVKRDADERLLQAAWDAAFRHSSRRRFDGRRRRSPSASPSDGDAEEGTSWRELPWMRSSPPVAAAAERHERRCQGADTDSDEAREELLLAWKQALKRHSGATVVSSFGFQWVPSFAAAQELIDAQLAEAASRTRRASGAGSYAEDKLREHEEEAWGDRVFALVNAEADILRQMAQSAAVGLHTMEEEHFGIAVVQLLLAGCCVVAHNSGGPRDDILVATGQSLRSSPPEDEVGAVGDNAPCPYATATSCRAQRGFLCRTRSEFAASVAAVISQLGENPGEAVWTPDTAKQALKDAQERFLDDDTFGSVAFEALHLGEQL